MCSYKKINIETDFLTFRESVIENLGDSFADQTDVFFERAVFEADNEMQLSAVSNAKFAIELGQFQKEIPIIYIYGFLSQVLLDLGKIKDAKTMCNVGIKLLDDNDSDYEKDKASFYELQEMIKSEGWKGDSDDFGFSDE